MKCVTEKEILRYLAGQLADEEMAAVARHMEHCRSCTAWRDRVFAMTRRLAADPGEFDDPVLAGEVMTLIRMGRADRAGIRARPAAFSRWLLVPAAAVLLGLVLVLAWPALFKDGTAGLGIRGDTTERADRWVSLQIFRATASGYEPVGDGIRTDDALAFTYVNRCEEGLFHLMIFAVDGGGRVFWYYPAHLREGENPESIRIHQTDRPVQLPDDIRHELNPGPLRVFGLFSKKPLHVAAVEAAVKNSLAAGREIEQVQRLDIAGTGQQSFFLKVK